MKKVRCLLVLLLCLPLLSLSGTRAQSGPPEIRSIEPDRVTAGHKTTIRGRNFSSNKDENIVRFGERQANVAKAKGKKLVVVVPDLAVGNHPVTVRVGSQLSNAVQVAVVATIVPLQGLYEGRTSRDDRFRFVVQENRRVVTELRTSFTCSTNTCASGATIRSNQLADIENNRFEFSLSGSNVTVRVEGVFVSETRAEGTVEFTTSGPCRCETGKLRWEARLD